MRRSVHRPSQGAYVRPVLPQVSEWFGFRECAFCACVIAPCHDCLEPWTGPCPHCLAPAELMLPVGVDGPSK